MWGVSQLVQLFTSRDMKPKYDIQHCFICRPSDSTVPTDAGIEPRTVATAALAVRRPNHSARSHPPWMRSSQVVDENFGDLTPYLTYGKTEMRRVGWRMAGQSAQPRALRRGRSVTSCYTQERSCRRKIRLIESRVADPNPNWIRIGSGSVFSLKWWIRIRIK